MAIDRATIETLVPSRFISFFFPNPKPSQPYLRVAVLDSPVQSSNSPQVAAMFVPEGRESDWVFCTESGHLQLLFISPGISRLILVGNQLVDGDASTAAYNRPINNNDSICLKDLERSLKPLFLALSPKSCFENDTPPEITIVSYEDNVISGITLEECLGQIVGEFLVEDVEIESSTDREFRRRLRFKRMPNLVQTEMRIVPVNDFDPNSIGIGKTEFRPDARVLVHPYLIPMVASLAIISSQIEECTQTRIMPRALCIGVGGGALPTFLRNELGLDVVGVEIDRDVLLAAKRYFGLEDGEFLHIRIGDAVEVVEELKKNINGTGAKFHVIMVDLDSGDATKDITAPPLEFVKKNILLACKSILGDDGILVMNVIPPSRLFYEELVGDFKKEFHDLYEIDVGNEENFVLIATVSAVVTLRSDGENGFLGRLRLAISGAYMDSIEKI